MSYLEPFKINLKGLKADDNTFDYTLDDAFFAAVDAPAVQHGSLKAKVTVHRIGVTFDLNFHIEGSVVVPCDLCLDDMEQPIVCEEHAVAKLGDNPSVSAKGEDDELIMVPERDGELDISWLVYEFIELNIPLRHVHAPGKCNPAMTRLLQEHSAARSGDEDGQNPVPEGEGGAVDTRWEALNKFKIQN